MSISFNQIPRDVQLLVFSYLRPEELGRCSRVCKIWYTLANTESLWRALPLPSIAFGKREWEKYLGDVGEEPPLPRGVYKVLKSSCPFWAGKRVEETHLLTLIPKTVNGKPLTLNSLNQLMQHPKQGWPTKYAYYPDGIAKKYGSKSLFKSTWVLLTKDLITSSGDLSFDEQVELLKRLSQKVGPEYEAPKLLETVTSIFIHYLCKKKWLYGWAFTRCQERASSTPNQTTAIGGFNEDGLLFANLTSDERNDLIRVGGMRKF